MKTRGILTSILAATVACGFARAETITQTLTGAVFAPGTDTLETFTFNQFDTLDGTRELISVTVNLTHYSWGGYFWIDNDGEELVSFTAQHGTGARLAAKGYVLPGDVVDPIYAIITTGETPITVPADDGDGPDYQQGGPDNVRLDGPEDREHAIVASSSGTLTSNLDAYIGTGTLDIEYYSSQASHHNAEGPATYTGANAYAQGIVTITYEWAWVPEPNSAALLALGCMVLGLRRRPSVGKRA